MYVNIWVLIGIGVFLVLGFILWLYKGSKAITKEFDEYAYELASYYIRFMEGMEAKANPHYDVIKGGNYDIVEIHNIILQTFKALGVLGVPNAHDFTENTPMWFSDKYEVNRNLTVVEWMRINDKPKDTKESSQPNKTDA